MSLQSSVFKSQFLNARTSVTALMVTSILLICTASYAQAQVAPNHLNVKRSASNGRGTFVTGRHGGALPVPAGRGRQAEPKEFLTQYGELFGVSNADKQLVQKTSRADQLGHAHTSYDQMHEGVRVFGGVLRVHQNAARSFVGANGHFFEIPNNLIVQPGIDVKKAEKIAQDAFGRGPLGVEQSELVIVDPAWYGDPPIGPHLAYYIILADTAQAIREGFFIDARNGAVLDEWTMIHGARVREIHNAGGTSMLPGPLARSEGQSPVANADVNRAYDYAGDTYDYYFRAFGRDSLNNAGMTVVVAVNSNAFPCPNAFWAGSYMIFCSGTVTDDIMGHELTHGVTQYTAGLFYQNQSGQLNESYSDIMGEMVDLFNGNTAFAGPPDGSIPWPSTPTGPGVDTPNNLRTTCSPKPGYPNGVRWMLGEDATAFGGAIRDFWNPTCYNQPDRAYSPLFTPCPVGDGGGVHFGSGVPNHAFAIMTDGKTFNGRTVIGIGPIKSAAVWYRALTVYLTPFSDFSDAYTALNQAAADLVGTTPNDPRTGLPSVSTFTAADAQQVDLALQATEMHTNGACGGSAGPSLALISPKGGESWSRNTTKTILWNTTGGGSTVTIDLMRGGSPVLNIATGVTNNGVFAWGIPIAQALGNDYRVRISSGVTNQSNADFTIAAEPPPCLELANVNFESGLEGFTINNSFGTGNGLWHLSTSCQSSTIGHSSPTSLYYGGDGSCNYDSGNTEGIATSPIITLPATTPIALTFRYYLQTEHVPASWDKATVEISQGGGPFEIVAGNNPADSPVLLSDPSNGWQEASIDLSNWAGTSIQIRFRFRTLDAAINNFPGFYVDDIQICGTTTCENPASPTGSSAIPSTTCSSGQSSTLSATPGSGGDIMEWFTVSCGGTLVPGGESPVVSPTSTTTYYARSKNTATDCPSTCSQVTVSVQTLLAPTGCQANPTSICSGVETSTLSAAPASGADSVEWFTGSCGGTPVPGGSSPVVSPTSTTTYYARSKNSSTLCASSMCCSVTVVVNNLPSIPTNPGPADGAIHVPLNQSLTWAQGSSSACPTTYNVLFGITNPPTTTICQNLINLECVPGTSVHSGTTYYWRVQAQNCCGSVSGPVWSFASLTPADFDLDGDVDITDFAHLQLCFNGAGVPQNEPACQDAKLNLDSAVDGADLTAFLKCLYGPNIPPLAGCAD